jgi:hypothetical protein
MPVWLVVADGTELRDMMLNHKILKTNKTKNK